MYSQIHSIKSQPTTFLLILHIKNILKNIPVNKSTLQNIPWERNSRFKLLASWRPLQLRRHFQGESDYFSGSGSTQNSFPLNVLRFPTTNLSCMLLTQYKERQIFYLYNNTVVHKYIIFQRLMIAWTTNETHFLLPAVISKTLLERKMATAGQSILRVLG